MNNLMAQLSIYSFGRSLGSCLTLLAVLSLSVVILPFSANSAQAGKGKTVSLYEYGADEFGYMALPDKPPKAGVLLIPDALGSRELVNERCDLLAQLGYTVLCLDIYNGKRARSRDDALDFQNKLNRREAAQAINAALNLLYRSPKYRAPRIIVGAWGGNLDITLEAMARFEGLVAISSVTWMEPGRLNASAGVKSLGTPLQVVEWLDPIDPKKTKAKYDRLIGERMSPTEVLTFNAAPGFLMAKRKADQPANLKAWVEVIQFWDRYAEKSNIANTRIPNTRSLDSSSLPFNRPVKKKKHPKLNR